MKAPENTMVDGLYVWGFGLWSAFSARVRLGARAGFGARAIHAFVGAAPGRAGRRVGSSGAAWRASRARVCHGGGVCSRAVRAVGSVGAGVAVALAAACGVADGAARGE